MAMMRVTECRNQELTPNSSRKSVFLDARRCISGVLTERGKIIVLIWKVCALATIQIVIFFLLPSECAQANKWKLMTFYDMSKYYILKAAILWILFVSTFYSLYFEWHFSFSALIILQLGKINFSRDMVISIVFTVPWYADIYAEI